MPPYSWTSTGGTLNASNGPYATLTGGSTASTITVTVTDSYNYLASVQITVGTTSTTATAVCEGAFSWVTGSTTSTLTLLADGNGNVAGYFGASATAVSGTCSGSSLKFSLVSNPLLTFNGTFYTNNSTNAVAVLGTYNGQSSIITPQ
jgi:hypothetical protein